MYHVEYVEEIAERIAALPIEAAKAFMELVAAVEVAPWNFPPASNKNPDGALRWTHFGPTGQGLVHFVILDDQRRVVVVELFWAG